MGDETRASRPPAGVSRSVGRYGLVCEVARGFFGPLWIGHDAFDETAPATVLLRRVRVGAALRKKLEPLHEAAEWARGIETSGLLRTIDVIKGDDHLDVVYPFVEGETLRALLRAAAFKRRVLPRPVVVKILCDLLDELSLLHAEASLQRSLRAFGGVQPDSVLVSSDGTTRLLDVGVAAVASVTEPWKRDPQRLAYTAPEQLEADAQLAAATDVFAVGTLAWELLTNRRLFAGTDAAILRDKIRKGTPSRLDEARMSGVEPVDKKLADVIAKALALDPAERHGSVAVFSSALREAVPAAPASEVASNAADLVAAFVEKRRISLDRFQKAAVAAGPPPSVDAPPGPASQATPAAPPVAAVAATPASPRVEVAPVPPDVTPTMPMVTTPASHAQTETPAPSALRPSVPPRPGRPSTPPAAEAAPAPDDATPDHAEPTPTPAGAARSSVLPRPGRPSTPPSAKAAPAPADRTDEAELVEAEPLSADPDDDDDSLEVEPEDLEADSRPPPPSRRGARPPPPSMRPDAVEAEATGDSGAGESTAEPPRAAPTEDGAGASAPHPVPPMDTHSVPPPLPTSVPAAGLETSESTSGIETIKTSLTGDPMEAALLRKPSRRLPVFIAAGAAVLAVVVMVIAGGGGDDDAEAPARESVDELEPTEPPLAKPAAPPKVEPEPPPKKEVTEEAPKEPAPPASASAEEGESAKPKAEAPPEPKPKVAPSKVSRPRPPRRAAPPPAPARGGTKPNESYKPGGI